MQESSFWSCSVRGLGSPGLLAGFYSGGDRTQTLKSLPKLAQPQQASVLVDGSFKVSSGEERIVRVGLDKGRGFCGIWVFRFECGQHPFIVTVDDCAEVARKSPMQLRALRASLYTKSWRSLRVKWICPLAPSKPILSCSKPPLRPTDLSSAAFKDFEAAQRWSELAGELSRVYGSRTLSGKADKAVNIIEQMAELLSKAHSRAVQRLCKLPLSGVNLDNPGRFVYCLASPFLSKVYVGATGFKRLRNAFDRWKEHMRLANLWASRASRRRYYTRTPNLYRALAQVVVHNVVLVVLDNASSSGELLAMERDYIRWLSPVFNVVGCMETTSFHTL